MYPGIALLNYIIMTGNIIISINIGQIIIFYMIISYRAPIGLTANI